MALAPEFERRWAIETELHERMDPLAELVAEHVLEIARRIEALPATTVEGFRLKARAVAWAWGDEAGAFAELQAQDDTYATRMTAGLLRGLWGAR